MMDGLRYPAGERMITSPPSEKGSSPVTQVPLQWKSGSPTMTASPG